MKLLDRLIKGYEMLPVDAETGEVVNNYDELSDEEKETITVEYRECIVEKQVRDIIDPSRDVWETKDGKKSEVLHDQGILKCIAFTKAIIGKADYIQTGNRDNNFRDLVQLTIRFQDGSESYGTGEADNSNTDSFTKKYKALAAEKRAYHRAFLRSSYIGFHDIYGEGESVDFRPEVLNDEALDELVELVALPMSDEKYPGELLKDVILVHEDTDYIKQLWKNPTHKMIRRVIKHLLETHIELRKKEEAKKAAEEKIKETSA